MLTELYAAVAAHFVSMNIRMSFYVLKIIDVFEKRKKDMKEKHNKEKKSFVASFFFWNKEREREKELNRKIEQPDRV